MDASESLETTLELESLKPSLDASFIAPGEEAKVLELLETVFDGWPKHPINCSPLEYWYWKYRDAPLKLTNITIVKTNGKIIGCNHGIYHKVKLFQKSLLSTIGSDSATHPEYRKMGVYTKGNDLRRTRTDEFNCKQNLR